MLVDVPVIRSAPQLGGLNVSSTADFGVLLVIVMFNVSPGFTCSVGSSSPSGVIRQYKVLPCASVLVWYENRTFNTP
jgi:hypothetical protein